MQAIESILVETIRRSGHHVLATKEYRSRVRGGVNSTSIRLSGNPISAYSERIGHEGMIDVPFERAAAEAGSPLYASSVAVGVISGLFRRDPDAPSGAIESYFGSKSNEVRAMNVAACRRGSEIGQRIKAERGFGPVACADHRIACSTAPLMPISVERKRCSTAG